jgi:hypothetical protein
LPLVEGDVRIQQILPLPPNLLSLINTDNKLVKEGHTEILWPLIDDIRVSKWDINEIEIEPADYHQLRYDFIIDSKVETIKIYSFFLNATKPDRDIGWDLATIYDISNR